MLIWKIKVILETLVQEKQKQNFKFTPKQFKVKHRHILDCGVFLIYFCVAELFLCGGVVLNINSSPVFHKENRQHTFWGLLWLSENALFEFEVRKTSYFWE